MGLTQSKSKSYRKEVLDVYWKNHIGMSSGHGIQMRQVDRMQIAMADKIYSDWYSHYAFHVLDVPRDGKVLLIFANADETTNSRAMALTSSRGHLFDTHCKRILEKEDHLTKARIAYLFNYVQDQLKLKIQERLESLRSTVQRDVQNDMEELSDSSDESPDVRDMKDYELLKDEEWHTHKNSTLVAITNNRIYVAGPGRLVTAIIGPTGVRVLSKPDLEANNVQVTEFQGTLSHEEFLVLFPRTLDVTSLEEVVLNEVQGVVDLANKLRTMDKWEQSSILVVRLRDLGGGSSSK